VPVSHPYRTIFVHIPKTAGTSVEAVLGMHGDKHDIGIRPYFNQQVDHEHLYGRDLQHLTAAELKHLFRHDGVFDRYFKFCVVRNPWERLVSVLAWSDQKWARGQQLSTAEFEAALRKLHTLFLAAREAGRPAPVPPHLRPQSAFVLDERRESLVDFIARYERLSQDWDFICERLGIRTALPLRMRSYHRSYQDYYTAESRARVAEIYAQDIDVFGYSFEQ
jgi:chondroitin 4-sulfotransferase 11